jgi:transcriptional regulator with XRE-family HTH domain
MNLTGMARATLHLMSAELLHKHRNRGRRGAIQVVSDIERGARNLSATMIEKLAKPLSVTPGRLLE